MTTAFAQAPVPNAAPSPPSGWPIGSYGTYPEAQHAVDHLASTDFPITDLTIVGVEPMIVERVTARLTLGFVLRRAVATGAWFGLFIGLLLSLLNPEAGFAPILIGLISGIGFAAAFGGISYNATKKKRSFVSANQLVARRYDLLCQPRNAERGRDLLADLAARAQLAG